MLAVRGIVLERVGHFEAAHVGHHQVEDDHVGCRLDRGAQAVVARVGVDDRVAEGREILFEERVDGRVVVDDQQTRASVAVA